MKAVSVLFLSLTITIAYGSLCTDLTGTWNNQLNSNMTIEHVAGTSFTGVYHTAVESSTGAARLSSKISGMIQPTENGTLIGFNVLWNHGASLTAWVGQCIACDGKETIYTSWVLRSYLPARKRWMTTRINQDTFSRQETTGHPTNQALVSSMSDTTVSGSDLTGEWISSSRDSLDVKDVQQQGTWTGMHFADGEDGISAVGSFDGNQTYTAIGFVAASPMKVRGYTGHIDNPETTDKVLETSWLEHTFHESCYAPRKFVKFGMDKYYKSTVPE